MKILKIWDGEYPWDVRTEKICRSLTEHGHDIHMVARNRDRRVLVEELEECTVHRLKPWSALGRSLDAASQFPAFMNPRWLGHAYRTGKRTGAELVLVRDLPLAPVGIRVGRRLGVPVVLDMAENYPAMIQDLWTTGSTKPGDFFVRNPRAVRAVERWTLDRVDHTIVVVEESGERLVAELGVPEDRITVVGNTPSRKRLDEAVSGDRAETETETTNGESRSPDAPLHLVYLGLLEEARGVGTVLEGAAMLRERGIPFFLTIIGDGRARGAFEARAVELNMDETVLRMPGFLPYAEALRVVAKAEVGIIPHMANESWNTTIPNKLFDYMAAGLAVLTSDAKPAARVVEETGCGSVFRSADPVSFADAVESMTKEGSVHVRGDAGRRAVSERYHWEVDEARLLDLVDRLVRVGHDK